MKQPQLSHSRNNCSQFLRWDSIKLHLLLRFPWLWRDRFRIIHIGFDMRHFKDLSMAQRKVLTLTIGLLTEPGNGIALFHAAKSGHD